MKSCGVVKKFVGPKHIKGCYDNGDPDHTELMAGLFLQLTEWHLRGKYAEIMNSNPYAEAVEPKFY